jgi:hypothetical protein
MTTMPSMTIYSVGGGILVPFPFTDQARAKQRPAVVVSSARYNTERRTLQHRTARFDLDGHHQPGALADDLRRGHRAKQAAKLLKLSAIKPVFTTIDKRLVRKSLGRLHETDRASLKTAMQAILG